MLEVVPVPWDLDALSGIISGGFWRRSGVLIAKAIVVPPTARLLAEVQ